MKKILPFFGFIILLLNVSCDKNDDQINISEADTPILDTPDDPINSEKEFKILALGDSYTIGESVCVKCRFPEQLKDSLILNFEKDTTFTLQIIAKTGWTTTNLINAISNENIASDFDIVTLLIGVNNQYQNKNFSIYEAELPALVGASIKAVNNDKNNLIVVSIPDYAFTPFGNGNTSISEEIDNYNEFAKNYCNQNGISFINITDITREGLINPNLVASDNLHPSALAYTRFVEKLLPLSIVKLRD